MIEPHRPIGQCRSCGESLTMDHECRPEKTEPVKELKPCFFCGQELEIVHSNTWKGYFIRCNKCVITYPINPEKYNNAYCWQQSDRDRELIRELVDAGYSIEDLLEIPVLIGFDSSRIIENAINRFRSVLKKAEKVLEGK